MQPTQPGTFHTEQNILNWSFDSSFEVLAIMMLGINGSSLYRLKSSTDGILYTTEQEEALKLDDTSTANVTYIGVAATGTAAASALWSIQKLDETSGLIITWADGNGNFDNIWNDRVSLSYS